MDPKLVIKENLVKAIKNLYDIDVTDVHIEHPENEEFGDYATNVAMKLAKDVKKSPIEIAETLVHELNSMETTFDFDDHHYPIFQKIDFVSPGFINFKLSEKWLVSILEKINSEKEKFGSNSDGAGKTIIVEFSQMNTNKPQHVGHARNNFIGSSLAEILKFNGYNVIKSAYAGDIGAHSCKSMLMYQKYGENNEPDKKPDHFVGDFYILFDEKVEKNPEIEAESQEMLRQWEAGNPEVVALWKKMNDWVYEGWKQTYEDQNVSYDIREYESDHVSIGKEIAQIAVDRGIAEKDESGAIIAKLEKYGLPDKVLLRSDGTSLYATKDLQLAKDSYEKYKFEKRLYVVDYRQSDYFKQVFKILEILGFDWFNRLFHIAYGIVNLPEGKISSRKGIIVTADDVFEKLVSIEKEEISNSIKNVEVSSEKVKTIALSAFRYGMLKMDPKQNMVFDYDQVTKFEGNTGPYLLYTYARSMSVLEKAGFDIERKNTDISDLVVTDLTLNDREKDVLRTLYKFSEVVVKAGDAFEPHHIAGYIFDLAHKFNTFYSECPILDSKDANIKNFRIALTHCTANVIKNGLNLLGIDVVEHM